MPGATAPARSPTLLESVVPLLHAGFGTSLLAAAQVVTLPAQVVLSGILVAAACAALRRQGRPEAALAWAAAWGLATAIEVVCKAALVRPALYRHGVHLVALDSSWPSGHAVRGAITAAALAAAWPRLRLPLALWVVAVAVLLETAGFHTPSDVLGGLLLAALSALGATSAERSGALRPRAARARAARAAAGGAPRRR
jgi:membrane-associated phospholipid phosphatase